LRETLREIFWSGWIWAKRETAYLVIGLLGKQSAIKSRESQQWVPRDDRWHARESTGCGQQIAEG
jgi:hypothetical protein